VVENNNATDARHLLGAHRIADSCSPDPPRHQKALDADNMGDIAECIGRERNTSDAAHGSVPHLRRVFAHIHQNLAHCVLSSVIASHLGESRL